MAVQKTSDAVTILRRRLEKNPKALMLAEVEYQRLRLHQLILQMREDSKLTQKELADRVGSKQSVVSRYESPSYSGINLSTLVKLADAMGFRVSISVEPKKDDEALEAS